MASIVIFLKVLIARFKILINKMNEKVGFEIMVYVTERAISMIIISMITNQN